MSESIFSSHDNEAAWKALGVRMRKNRRWLLIALVGLGLYMAAQSWAHLRRHGDWEEMWTADVETSSGDAATPPATERQPDHPAKAAVAPKAQAQHAAPTTADRDKPSTSPKPASGRSANNSTAGPQPTVKAPRPANQGAAHDRALATEQAAAAKMLGLTFGQWFAEWDALQRESRRDGLRLAASTAIREARKSLKSRTSPAARLTTEAPFVGPSLEPSRAAEAPRPKTTTLSAERPSTNLAGLLIANPSGSGGPVQYLVNGDEHLLKPGETQELPKGRWLIEFHRGGDFGDTAMTLSAGEYNFKVTRQGWDLISP
jgi:hypothetical protein